MDRGASSCFLILRPPNFGPLVYGLPTILPRFSHFYYFFYSRFPLPWPLIPFSFTNGSRPINSLSRHLYTGFIAPPCPSLIFLANSRTETLSSAIYPRFMSYCLLLPPTNLLLLLTPTCIFFTPAFIFRFPFPSLPVPSSLTTGLSVPAPLYTDYRPLVQPLMF